MIYSVIYPYFSESQWDSHKNITQYCTMALYHYSQQVRNNRPLAKVAFARLR
ncbi:hypothetical protein FJSC11DRAFT_0935 [Fischerella thermalis JSC-11]|uniref:Uncharacterized protein n=1 Tax=Fischerella thermalis JSC-11 TaxID=741277 RepID=G6FPY8_9CYAN|nr:hypothetical protein FJSC11DRAFT_0935 [Fischerella thermalis JSC-11]